MHAARGGTSGHVPSLRIFAVLFCAVMGCYGISRSASGTTPSSAAPLQRVLPTEYHAYGDSITYGTTLAQSTQSYPYLLAQGTGLKVVDYGRNGVETCSILSQFVLSYDGHPSVRKNILYSLLSGTNDLVNDGTGPQEAIFDNCREAVLTWLSIPDEYRAVAGTPAFEGAQGCAEGGFCTAAGTIKVSDFPTTGAPMYIWYRISDMAAAASSFTVTVDGMQQGTYTTKPQGTVKISKAGTRDAVALIRVPLRGGRHTVVFSTATGEVVVYGVGTRPPGDYASRPTILVGDLPTQQKGHEISTLADQQAFSADIRGTIALTAAEGFDVRLVPTRRYLLGEAAEFNDALHPNTLGQQHLYEAFSDTLGSLGSQRPITPLQEKGVATAVPAADLVYVAPRTKARFTLPPAIPEGRAVTVYNSSTSGAHAVLEPGGRGALQISGTGTQVTSIDLRPGHSVTFFPQAEKGVYTAAVR